MRSLICVILGFCVLSVAGCVSSGSGSSSAGSSAGSASPSGSGLPVVSQSFAPFVSAESIASLVGAVGFVECGPAPFGGVSDWGVARLNGVIVGIDTFPGSDIRDRWETAVRSFGIAPIRSGERWVVWRALNQTSPSCG